jgi:hypothetical protein
MYSFVPSREYQKKKMPGTEKICRWRGRDRKEISGEVTGEVEARERKRCPRP